MQSASLALPVAWVEALPPSRLLHCVQAAAFPTPALKAPTGHSVHGSSPGRLALP